MRISDIKRQKRNQNRFSIYIDGKYAFSIDYDTLDGSHIHIGDTVSDDEKKVLIQKDEFSRVRDYAHTLLSYRDRTEYEIKTRLFDKGFHAGTIREVLEFLKSRNLIDDKSFAGKWVDNIFTSRPMGRMRVEHELKKRRINEDIIQEVCDKRLGQDTEYELARKAAEKKLNSLKSYPGEIARKRLFSFLRNRGFDFEIIRDLMKEYFSDVIE